MDHTTRLPWLIGRLRSVVTVHAHQLGRTGTGFVVSVDGYLLTAAHCVVDDSCVPTGGRHEPDEDITVACHDGGTYSVELVGFDMHADVAVLRLPVGNVRRLSPIPVRRHTYPTSGDTCVVVGNIFGQDPRSVAVGAVRNGRWQDPHGLSLLSTVLTDVVTGAGTSGGPILDAAGYVVGLHAAAYGSTPPVDPVSEQVFRNLDDWLAQANDDEAQQPMVSAGSTQLGGGLASPMLWRIYEEICANPTRGLTKRTLPCTVTPCVPGNVGRIRRALGKDAGWSLPVTAGGYCVTAHTDNGLAAGDVVVSVSGTRVGLPGLASLHDVTWLQHGTTSVEVLRGGASRWVPDVQLVPLPAALDVAAGYTQGVFALKLSHSLSVGGYTSIRVMDMYPDTGYIEATLENPITDIRLHLRLNRVVTAGESFTPVVKLTNVKTSEEIEYKAVTTSVRVSGDGDNPLARRVYGSYAFAGAPVPGSDGYHLYYIDLKADLTMYGAYLYIQVDNYDSKVWIRAKDALLRYVDRF